MRKIRTTKTITAEVTYEMSQLDYFGLMGKLDVPFTAKISCPQAPKPNYPGYITWTWEEEVEVDL